MFVKIRRLLLSLFMVCYSVLSPFIVPNLAHASLSQTSYGIPDNARVTIDGTDGGQSIFHVWNVQVDGSTVGTDLGLQRDQGGGHYKGYPKIDVGNLRDWVSTFHGDLSYVSKTINQYRSNLLYHNQNKATLYSLSEIANLSGARGDNWTEGTNYFVTSDPPKANINTKTGSTTFKVGDVVQIHGYGESNSYYNRQLTVKMTGPGLNYSNTLSYPNMGLEYVARYTSPDQSIKLTNPGTATYTITVTDGVNRTTTSKISLNVQAPQPPPPGGKPGAGISNGPTAIFDLPSSAKVNEKFNVQEHSKPGDAPINSWDWKVTPNGKRTGLLGGNGLSQIAFQQEGSYDITLTVKDSKERQDSVTHTIYIGNGAPPPAPTTPEPDPPSVNAGSPEPVNLPPIARFTYPSSVKQGGTANIIDGSYDQDGTIVDRKWEVTPPNGVHQNLGDTGGTITFDEEGEYEVKLTVTDDGGLTATVTGTITTINRPPVAKIGAPDEVIQGDDLQINSNSYDPDGTVKNVYWSISPNDGTLKDCSTGQPYTLSGDSNKVFFDKPGSYTVTLTAEDDQGKKSTPETKTIVVKPAVPVANISLADDSYPKQNRKVIFDSSTSSTSKRYPIDWNANNWQFIPPPGVSQDDIKIVNSPDKKTRIVLFKQPGDYKVRLQVTNAAGNTSDWYEFPIIIYPDLKPTVDFYVAKTQIRDAANGGKAAIALEDKSSSPDGDIISRRVWKYRYDSNNDGNFNDEQWVTLDSGNNPNPVLYTNKVGKYQFELYVEESFGQPTIPEFIGPADLRYDDTSSMPEVDKTVEVINLPPYADFRPRIKKKADIIFTVGDTDPAKVNDLKTKITQQIESKLGANGVQYNITSVSTSQLNMQDTFNWQEYSHYYTDTAYHGATSNGHPTTDHIVLNGRSITFYGYDAPNHKDFLFMPNNTPGKKTFDFAVDEKLSTYHSLEGAGYLFNASIDNGIINGYAILSGQYDLMLVKIKNADVNVFHEGGLGDLGNSWGYNSAFTVLGHYPKNGNYHQFHIEVTPTQIDAWDGANKIINAVQLPEILGNGFGPMASYYGHGCNQLTQVTFSNIQMQTVTGKSLDEILKAPEWSDGALRFVATISDKTIAEFNDPVKSSLIYSRLLEGNLDYSVLGTWQNQLQANHVISQNNNSGTFIDNGNIDAALSQYADYILAKVNEQQGPLSNYVLLGQEVQYDYFYDDVENDPQIEQKWFYNHDPNYFQNSLGLASFNTQALAAPVYKFDKVGEYDVKFQVRDNPLNDNRFDNYRQWSPLPEQAFQLFVHRKPFAVFNVATNKINATDYSASFSDASYDLDHQYEPGKGIVATQWKWKQDLGDWVNGTPNILYGGHVYSIYLRVQDKEGAWSDPTVKVISLSGNLPPVANFTVTPNPVEIGKTLSYTDLSYDPNPGDFITYRHWRVQRLSDNAWFDYGSNPPDRFWGLGKYQIELTVQDSYGAVSTPYSQIVDVIQANHPPVARFTVTPNPLPADVKESYSDTSYDPDNDPIVAREWRYSKNGGPWIDGQPTDIGQMGVGLYKIQLRVKDQPPISSLTPLWSDWYEQTVTVVPGNQKPVAHLSINPNPVPADELVTWVDKSTDPEGKNLQAYDLLLTQQETGVTKEFTGVYSKGSGYSLDMSAKFINQFDQSTFPNEGVGTYTVEFRVKDTTSNGLSPALWSDFETQTLVVEDPLKIQAKVAPPVQKSGAAVSLIADTTGRAEKVIAKVDWNRDGKFDGLNETIQLTNDKAIGEKYNSWQKNIIIPLPTKDGDYTVTFTAYRGAKSVETMKTVKVQGVVYDNFVIEMNNR